MGLESGSNQQKRTSNAIFTLMSSDDVGGFSKTHQVSIAAAVFELEMHLARTGHVLNPDFSHNLATSLKRRAGLKTPPNIYNLLNINFADVRPAGNEELRSLVRGLERAVMLAQIDLCKKMQSESRQRNEIHGITRARLAAIFESVENGEPIQTNMLEEEPSILEEVRSYLSRWGITDRISYHKVLMNYQPGIRTGQADYSLGGDMKDAFPRVLMSIVLGQQLKNTTRDNVETAGDLLYGALDREALAAKYRDFLGTFGIQTRDELIASFKYRTLEALLARSAELPIRNIRTLIRAFDLRSDFTGDRMEILADALYNGTVR